MGSTNQFLNENTEQSTVKSKLVSYYFGDWTKMIIPTIKKTPSNRIAYIDLFAGPGHYRDGTKSTPLLEVISKPAV
jgi:three-Cys-motif partner protein